MKTDKFTIRDRIRQDGLLSTPFFTISVDNNIKEYKMKTKVLSIGYRNQICIKISVCGFVVK